MDETGDGVKKAETPAAANPGAGAADARRLFTQSCSFIAGAARLDQLPPAGLPEVAVVGRSNVGKSSLLNALTGRHSLARVSHTPGRTRQLNFFELGAQLMLVDLPGYGFAKAPKSEIAAWTRLIEAYLLGRQSLRRVLVLIDCRRGIGDADDRLMGMLDHAGVSFTAVLTKADELPSSALSAAIADAVTRIERHPAAYPGVIATSARTGAGIEHLREALAPLASWAGEMPTSDGGDGDPHQHR